MRRLFLAIGLFLTTALATVPAHASDYSLTASGTWVSDNGLYNGTWQAHFDVAGFDLSGTLNLIGMPGIAEGNIAGSWDLDNLGFGVLFLDQELASFTGGLDGDRFIGHFDTGDLSGTWSGLLDRLEFTADPVQPIVDGTIPTLLLSRTGGNIGDIVQMIATLKTLGQAVSGIENIINFDSVTPILANAFGKPDCEVNPAINKADTLFEFLPQGCAGSGCTQVRAIVRSLSNVAAIADGAQLYSCKLKIASKATSGIHQLIASALTAVNTILEQIPINSLPGEIKVKKLGDCHCSTLGSSVPLPMISYLAPLALLVVRRRARRRSA